MDSFLLILLRILAFVIDVTLISILFFITFAVYMVFDLQWSRTSHIIVLVFIILYFVFFECKYNGQTLGKRLVGIAIRQLDNSPINIYSSAIRIISILSIDFIIPFLTLILIEFYNIPFPYSKSLNSLTIIYIIALFSCGIIISGGKFSFFDLFASTKIIRLSKNNNRLIPKPNLIYYFVIPIFITFLFFPFFNKLFDYSVNSINKLDRANIEHYNKDGLYSFTPFMDLTEFFEQIPNYYYYFKDDVYLDIKKCDKNIDQYSFYNSAQDVIPKEIPSLKVPFQQCPILTIEVTNKGFISDTFHHEVERMLEYFVLPDIEVEEGEILLRIDYIYSHQFQYITYELNRRRVLMIKSIYGKPRIVFSLEPDDEIIFSYKVFGNKFSIIF